MKMENKLLEIYVHLTEINEINMEEVTFLMGIAMVPIFRVQYYQAVLTGR